ncbi:MULTISPECIES: hypothetical protein [Flectobacillus]|uniref:Uncharacterized protein n=1 Tax=Flectobacillus rivi TaxID=2984209 RepID=A0ABT6Z1L8_9BACT|nr:MULTISPECIES: hypothetical protein [Flectobacillus]MDI9875026.1 hypothetical protein [Flectobacillus rivi]MDI9882443.1 hypothetical protein [Flectobacillus longus]
MNLNVFRNIYYTDSDMLLEIPVMGFIIHDFSDLAQAGFFLLSAIYVYWKIKNEKLKHENMKSGKVIEDNEDDN